MSVVDAGGLDQPQPRLVIDGHPEHALKGEVGTELESIPRSKA
jgi:hypothetical protein